MSDANETPADAPSQPLLEHDPRRGQPYMRWLRGFVGSAPLIMPAAAACIRDSRGRVLLMRRGGELSELWGFPGGAMELGESAADAAVREAREEVGLEVVAERLIGVYSGPEFGFRSPGGDQVQLLLLFFECQVRGGTLRADGDESLEVRYFGADDVPPPMRACCQAKLRDAFAPQTAAYFR